MGVNYQQLPVNAPRNTVVTNSQDGVMSLVQRTGDTNYEPSALRPVSTVSVPETKLAPQAELNAAFAKEENFYQAGEYYRSLDAAAKTRLINNFSGDLKQVRDLATRTKIVSAVRQADKEYGDALAAAVGVK